MNVKRTIAATLVAGAMGATLAFAAPSAGASTAAPLWEQIKIEKVNYNPAGPDTATNINDEWVLLRNTSYQSVNLAGMKLKLRSGNTVYTFGNLTLPGWAGVKVHTGTGTNVTVPAVWGAPMDVYAGKTVHSWPNTNNRVRLTKWNTQTDQCRWFAQFPGVKTCLVAD